jgi:2-oxoglutarate dehydrogenase E2 component (dihydrolipoamide succinyltransferase)
VSTPPQQQAKNASLVQFDARPDDRTKAESEPRQTPSSTDEAQAQGTTTRDETTPREAAEAGIDDESQSRLGPAVRKMLEEHALDADEIDASGKNGRVTKADVISHLESRPGAPPSPRVAETARTPPAPGDDLSRPERRVAMTRLRKRVAERLLAAQHQNAILTTFNEVDMQPVLALRQRYREQFEKAHDVRLGFMAFFVLAAVEALKRFPVVNASVNGEDIIYHGYFDIGIAVSSPRGLVVPILRNAHRLSMAEIEKAVAEFGRKARDNTLTLEELSGGTFTITNGGVFGSLLSTPILNPPQSAILGMHKIEDRPIARDAQVVVRPMMYLALSYDHRIIDGREAVQFLVTIKEQLEDPTRLLLQI